MHRSILVSVLVLGLATPVLADPQIINDYFNLAKERESLQDYSGAIDIYNALIQEFPNEFPGVYAARAEDFDLIGDKAAAIKDYDMALLLVSDDATDRSMDHNNLLENRGRAKTEVGDYHGAIEDFTAVLAVNPMNSFVFSERARAKLRASDCAGSAMDYSSALQLRAASINFEGRAVSRICLGDLEGSAKDYQRANQEEKVQSNKLIGDAHLTQWAVMMRIGRKREADTLLSLEVAGARKQYIDPAYDAANYFLGLVEESVFLRDIDVLKVNQPKFADSLENTARYYTALKLIADGENAAALSELQAILDLPDTTNEVHVSAQAWIMELNRYP